MIVEPEGARRADAEEETRSGALQVPGQFGADLAELADDQVGNHLGPLGVEVSGVRSPGLGLKAMLFSGPSRLW